MELKIQGLSIGRTQKKNAQTKISLSHDFGARYIDLLPIMDQLEVSANSSFLFWSQIVFWCGVLIATVGAFL